MGKERRGGAMTLVRSVLVMIGWEERGAL